MTIELLTLISLWCGSPVTHNIYSEGPEITLKDVNECRTKLITCVENEGSSHMEGTMYYAANPEKCFKQVSYPGKDN